MLSISGALITGGICISYWIDLGLSFADGSVSWRFPLAFQIFFALIILAFILELPESPRWLILKGKEEEALQVLGALSDRGIDDPYIHSEFAEIKDTVIEMSKGGFKELFTNSESMQGSG
jgi:MFS family permease